MRWLYPNQSKVKSDFSTIHVALQGGLGNQLFQFANGAAKSLHLNASLRLEDNLILRDNLREYSLRNWNLAPQITYEITLRDDDLKFKEIDSCHNHDFKKLEEKDFHFTDMNEHIISGVSYRLVGYWQSELNFLPFKSPIRNFLRAGLPSEGSNTGTSIHIRRGDFVKNPKTFAYHGVLGFDYYLLAISLLDAATTEIDVITDSFEEIHELIKMLEAITGKVFNLRTDLKDEISALNALASSSQVIIANSSFSWWGAYLSEAQKVIAPRKYFSEKTLRALNTSDLYPEGWILI